MPRPKSRQSSDRALIRAQYQQALKEAVLESKKALIVELEDGDSALTIRNRLKRAAERLGLEHVTIRRWGNRILAYQDPEEELQEMPEVDATGT